MTRVSDLVNTIHSELQPVYHVTPGGLKWSRSTDALRELAALAALRSRGSSGPEHPGPPDVPGQEQCSVCGGFLGDDAYGHHSRMCRCERGSSDTRLAEAAANVLRHPWKHIPTDALVELQAALAAAPADTRLTEALREITRRMRSGGRDAWKWADVIDAALAAARADAPQDPNEEDGQIWGPT